ncbi:MAG: PDDEXK nuclease domain-containing protein [Prevotellaceae bacterium]|jgi:predicted nuclease of restriction endonuclease-like (RecB) superfamily|nr:PDDEXK nuclease domain-containing protein [Prevotellaceae bacterium]
MSKLIKIDEEYKNWISKLSESFRISQLRASIRVNAEMLRFYWALGRDIVELKVESKWGDGIIKAISQDLQQALPDVKGFSITNINYIRRFYSIYSQLDTICPQVGGKLENADKAICPQAGGKLENADEFISQQLEAELFSVPWGHHKVIIDKYHSSPQKALFYVRKTIQHNWSRSVLLNFVGTDLYEREGKAITNFASTLPALQSDLAQEMTKDPYNFDFLAITEHYREKELKDALVQNITNFLLELGTGFAFVGREYRLQIGQVEKFIDMLFYNLNLRCYVVVEIKVKEFDSDNVGQLGTYIAAVNHTMKRPEDNPTVGLLICKTKDNVLAQYALESSNQPIGISEYELTKLYPSHFKGTLPSIEDIENELKDDLSC